MVFRERKCNFSLDFPAFGPSVLVGPRKKSCSTREGLRLGTGFGEFRQLQEVLVFSYSVIFDFKSFVNDLECLRS